MDRAEFVVVANRLPVDRLQGPQGEPIWGQSPGGLVTALEPVMRDADGAWVGWVGQPDLDIEPFEFDGMSLVPVRLSAEDVELYYEGFSNDTIWPLYHDVIAAPRYRRIWWEAYQRVNRRFADAAAEVAAEGAIVWVQDYQLQLVPAAPARSPARSDHRLLPPHSLPGIRSVLTAALASSGAAGTPRGRRDRIPAGGGCRKLRPRGAPAAPLRDEGVRHHGAQRRRHAPAARSRRHSRSRSTPRSYIELAQRPEVKARAREIRESLGNPKRILLGVDRLDYTKGIPHRMKAFGELLDDGKLTVQDVTLVQVASPSRERVEAYISLRDEIELMVGRINGDYDTMDHTAIRYLHQNYPREEMVALYLAADVMLVTALRDGMNLVAKEYVAARTDNRGVLRAQRVRRRRGRAGQRDPRQPARHRRPQGRHHARGRDAGGGAGATHARAAPPRARSHRGGLVERLPRGAVRVPQQTGGPGR